MFVTPAPISTGIQLTLQSLHGGSCQETIINNVSIRDCRAREGERRREGGREGGEGRGRDEMRGTDSGW